jgi:hypothetical protein
MNMRKAAPHAALFCLTALAAVLFVAPLGARADDNNLSYDDPAIHYSAPDGWTKADLPPSDEGPKAVFSKQFDRYDIRAITLKIEKYDGSLDGLETNHESDLRSQTQDMFVENKKKITMPNGMPAWQVKYTYGSDAGQVFRVMEYLVFDGRRSIDLAYAGRAGMFDDQTALAALSTLTVVLYPEDRDR